jgi:hypothetical protein
MAASKEVAQTGSTEIEGFSQAELDELNASITGQVKSSDIELPAIRLAQGISDSVADGIAKAGEFVNSLTDENYGDEFEFIFAYFFYGQALAVKEPQFFGATTSEIIPQNWPHPDAGKPFVESDDYEENFKRLVNAGEKEWGSGPGFSTTYNFVGFVLDPDRPDDEEPVPARLSFMRSSTPAAKKLLTLFRLERGIWNSVYKITRKKGESDKGNYYVAEVAKSRKATPDEIALAVPLAKTLKDADQSSFALTGDDPDIEQPGGAGSVDVEEDTGGVDIG